MPKSAVPDRASRHDQEIRYRSEQHHRDQCSRPPVPAENRVRRDDAGDLHHDAPSELLAAHGESTALGIGQAKRPRAQVLPEDPILLPEIRDQIVLVAVHPASERENEEL